LFDVFFHIIHGVRASSLLMALIDIWTRNIFTLNPDYSTFVTHRKRLLCAGKRLLPLPTSDRRDRTLAISAPAWAAATAAK